MDQPATFAAPRSPLKWSDTTVQDYRDIVAKYAQNDRIIKSIASLGDYFENEGDHFGFRSDPAVIYYIPHEAPTPSDDLILEVEALAANGKRDEILVRLVGLGVLKMTERSPAGQRRARS